VLTVDKLIEYAKCPVCKNDTLRIDHESGKAECNQCGLKTMLFAKPKPSNHITQLYMRNPLTNPFY